MELKGIAGDVIKALIQVDMSKVPYRSKRPPYRLFQPGVGPYAEPQLVKLIATHLNNLPKYKNEVITKRDPDLLISSEWAIEFKITRPYGDNGKKAEGWSVNLLHPYIGSVSCIGDCLKLAENTSAKRKGVIVIGYEHVPAKTDLTPLVCSFEILAKEICGISLSPRLEIRRNGLIHPVHQAVRVFAWEVMNNG